MLPRFHISLILSLFGAIISSCGKSGKSSHRFDRDDAMGVNSPCISQRTSACEASRFRIDDLAQARDEALSQNDFQRVARISLELNQEEERLRILSSNKMSLDILSKLESKYAKLNVILENQLAETATFRSASTVISGELGLPGIVYDQREAHVVHDVMNEFGDLYIKQSGTENNGNPRWEELKVGQPWAGYWFPLSNSSLFEGETSPLVKLDKVASKRGITTQAAAVERTQANLSQETWEGRCAAWAMASILSKEPNNPRDLNGISFSVSDQKALITKIFELYPHKIYGIRYDGDTRTDGTFQDLRPEAVHRIFMHQLGERHRAFIIDDSSGIEIWSKPVYRMKWTIQPDPRIDSAFLVTAQPWLIKHRNSQTDELTSDKDRASPEWTYRLYVNPKDVKGESFRVIAGEWIGSSRDHHPDTLTVPNEGKQTKSSNVEINKILDAVTSFTEMTH